jgi:hypothetical protein
MHSTSSLKTKLNVPNIVGCNHERGGHGLRPGYASSLLNVVALLFIIQSMLVMIAEIMYVFLEVVSYLSIS